jgi:hypothetical protein
MAEDLIDSYVDRAGVKGDTDYIVSALQQVQKEFMALKGIQIDLKGMQGLGAVAPAMQQATAGADSLAAATQTVTNRMAVMNGQSKEFTQVLLLQTKAEKEAVQTSILKQKAADAAAKGLEREKKAAVDTGNAYKQLSQDYTKTALAAKNFNLTLGANNPLTIAATRNATEMGNKLKALDASTGTFTRNVGNYGGALVEYGKKAFGFIRVAANILPGLGLSGAFLLIFEGFDKVISLFKSKISEATKAKERFNKVNDESIQKYAEEKLQIEETVKRIRDENTTNAEKKLILEEVNKKWADQVGQLKDVNELETVFVAKSKALIDSLILRAKAQAAFALATEASKKSLQGQLGLESAQKDLANAPAFIRKNILKQINSDIADTDKATQAYLAMYEKFSAAAANIETRNGLNPTKDKSSGGRASTKSVKDDSKKLADEKAKVLFEIQALQLQQTIDFNKKISEDENKSLVDRLAALRRYYEASQKLIEGKADLERILGNKTTEELKLIESKRFDELYRLQISFDEQRVKIKEQSAKKQEDEEKRLQSELEKGIEERAKAFFKSEEDRTKKAKEEGDKRFKDEQDLANQRKKLQEDLVKELTALSFTLFTASIERQKNALQDQIDLLEAKKQKDIEVANQTVASATDRAAAIAIIEARSAAQKEQLQKKQRDLDVKKAQFDKANAIARIIQETAIALISSTLKPALIPLVVAIGAAQLAAVIAQPIPRYKHGKNVNDLYEGPAIVDDGGRPEAIIREDGRIEIGSNKPRLIHLKKRDIVLPDANMLINHVLAGNMGGSLKVGQSVPNENKELKDIKGELKNVVSAIRNQPKLNMTANEAGLSAMWQYGANQIKYITQQTNW